MRNFKVRPEGFKEVKKKMIVRFLIMGLLVVGIVIPISILTNKAKTTDLTPLFLFFFFYAGVMIYSLNRNIKKAKEQFLNYSLTLDENTITRYRPETPSVRLYHNEITTIAKTEDGGFVIKGKKPQDIILVPPQMEDYADLETALGQIKPFTLQSKSVLEKYPLLSVLLIVVLMGVTYVSRSKILVALCGISFLGIMGWSLYKIQTSKNVDHRTKRASWIVLIVMASVTYVVIIKLAMLSKR